MLASVGWAVQITCTSRWDLSILIEKSSPMRFEKLSPQVYDYGSVIMKKKNIWNHYWTWADRVYHMTDDKI